MSRVYVPSTFERLRRAWDDGAIDPTPDVVVAEGDDEDSEYAALMTAADASTELLTGPGRRVVVVAELRDGADLSHPIPFKRVVAVHADTVDRPTDADPDDEPGWFATQEIPGLLS